MSEPELTSITNNWDTFDDFVKGIKEVVLEYMIDMYNTDEEAAAAEQAIET